MVRSPSRAVNCRGERNWAAEHPIGLRDPSTLGTQPAHEAHFDFMHLSTKKLTGFEWIPFQAAKLETYTDWGANLSLLDFTLSD